MLTLKEHHETTTATAVDAGVIEDKFLFLLTQTTP